MQEEHYKGIIFPIVKMNLQLNLLICAGMTFYESHLLQFVNKSRLIGAVMTIYEERHRGLFLCVKFYKLLFCW